MYKKIMLNVNEFFKNISDKLFKDKIILFFGVIIFVLFIYSITYSFNTYRNYSVLWNIPSKYKLEKIDTLKNYFVKEELSPNEKGDSIGGILNPIIGLMGVLLTFLAFYVQYQANNRILNFDEDKKILLNKKIAKAIVWELEEIEKHLEILELEYKEMEDTIKIDEQILRANAYIIFDMEILKSIEILNILNVFEYEEIINIFQIKNKIEYLKLNTPLTHIKKISNNISNREEIIKNILSLFSIYRIRINETKELIRPIVLKYKN